MHIQPEGMADAVHEIFAEGRFVRILLLDVRHLQQAQVHQFFFDEGVGFLLPVLGQLAGRGGLAGRSQHAEHGIIHLLLVPREATVHGDGAREVGAVIRVTGRNVQQEQLPAAARLIVLQVPAACRASTNAVVNAARSKGSPPERVTPPRDSS